MTALRLLPVGLLYWLVVVIDHAVQQSVAARDQREATARLEAQVAHARLAALKLQLHFLFNALHSISALIRTDRSAEAVRVTAGLGDLLRRLLDDAGVQEVTLREELALIKDYSSIELVRFSDRLQVDYDVAPNTEDALVPHLLLQPLVQNALRHGLQPRARGGCLAIRARRTGATVEEQLQLTVSDNGVGIRDGGNGGDGGDAYGNGGLGLANARARLAELYGARQTIEVSNLETGGTAVRITMPFRRPRRPPRSVMAGSLG